MQEIIKTETEIQNNTEELLRLYTRIELIKTRKELLEQRLIMLKNYELHTKP
jgi:hypothetical protein